MRVCVRERGRRGGEKEGEKEKYQFIFNEAPTCSLAQEFLFMGPFQCQGRYIQTVTVVAVSSLHQIL